MVLMVFFSWLPKEDTRHETIHPELFFNLIFLGVTKLAEKKLSYNGFLTISLANFSNRLALKATVKRFSRAAEDE